MIRWLQVLSLILAVVAGAAAVITHRRSAGSGATQWGLRASLLLSLGIVVGSAPTLLFPSATWLRWAASLLSLALTGASIALLRRQWRALQSRTTALGR
jgi:hypothetical protein